MRERFLIMSREPLSLMRVFSGWNGYQISLVRAVESLTPEQLVYRPVPDKRSVGEVAGHIAFGRIDWFNRMGAPGSAELADQIAPFYKTGVRHESAISNSAEEIIRWLQSSWQMIEANLNQWTIADLQKSYLHEYRGKLYDVSYQWTIWRIMAHDIHHGGQLTVLLGMLGVELPDLGDQGGHIIEVPLAYPEKPNGE